MSISDTCFGAEQKTDSGVVKHESVKQESAQSEGENVEQKGVPRHEQTGGLVATHDMALDNECATSGGVGRDFAAIACKETPEKQGGQLTKRSQRQKKCGLTHELVGDILMCWSMLRRLASHLTLPDLALETFVAAMCSTPGSQIKGAAVGCGYKQRDAESEEEGGGEQQRQAVEDDAQPPVRATYQDDVYISLLAELCSELKRREALVPSSAALNVHTWPEALRTYLVWMAHHVYLVSVGCDRGTQNERPDTQDGTHEGKRRLREMEEEMKKKSDDLQRLAQLLKVDSYAALSLADRMLILSTLCNQVSTLCNHVA